MINSLFSVTYPNSSPAGVDDWLTNSASPQSTGMAGVQDSPSVTTGWVLTEWKCTQITKENSTRTDAAFILNQLITGCCRKVADELLRFLSLLLYTVEDLRKPLVRNNPRKACFTLFSDDGAIILGIGSRQKAYYIIMLVPVVEVSHFLWIDEFWVELSVWD